MKERPVPAAGEVIIRQGEEGDNFYVVEQGRFGVDVDGREVVQIGPGGSFGELALMYNTQRAATVTSLTPGKLLQVDRGTFRRVIIDFAYQKRCKYMDFLRTVPLLQALSEAEIGKVADALEAVSFPAGQEVIKQGDPGDAFYIISDGSAAVIKDGVHVAHLHSGDYFGELALLERQPRAASVIAQGVLKCLTLGEADFVRLIGPLKKR
jgi:cAMP-dependent protein kinase regulator